MTITERTLRKWRGEALKTEDKKHDSILMYKGAPAGLCAAYLEYNKGILRLTQELLDQHLLRK